MIKTGSFVKLNCSGLGLVERMGIDEIDAYKIQNKIGVVSQTVKKDVFAVNFTCLNNGFDYRFEKRYLMKA